ncbi:MAG: hypothetical protein JW730_05740 [Anaerolineales bacterium]|nr:hypothetical protein [Anaerolineales bacterium]
MKKHRLVYSGIILLICLLVVAYPLLREEKPEYFMPEIPMPQHLATYEGEYAAKEEFATLVDNAMGYHLRYFVYRMYVPVFLGEDGFETESDIENYYDGWLKKLGWQEVEVDLCGFENEMGELLRRAYVYPTEHYRKPYACLAIWSEFDDGRLWTVLLKTINPSRDLQDMD